MRLNIYKFKLAGYAIKKPQKQNHNSLPVFLAWLSTKPGAVLQGALQGA